MKRSAVILGAEAVLGCALLAWGQAMAGAQAAEAVKDANVAANSSDGGGMPAGADAPLPGSALADPSHGYVIGPGDILSVNVWKDTELSRVMPVRPDGKISLPVLGELQASGLTALQLQNQISDKLREYMRNPQVNVIVQQIKSRTFNVVGKVIKAGAYDLDKPVTVLDAIAVAGGFQDFAKPSKIYVLRRGADGSAKMLPFNYKQVIKGKRSDENVQLQSGDTVVVP